MPARWGDASLSGGEQVAVPAGWVGLCRAKPTDPKRSGSRAGLAQRRSGANGRGGGRPAPARGVNRGGLA